MGEAGFLEIQEQPPHGRGHDEPLNPVNGNGLCQGQVERLGLGEVLRLGMGGSLSQAAPAGTLDIGSVVKAS